MASSESKKMDNEGLEGGLACIGTVLEATERKIADLWNQYENTSETVNIYYPRNYSLKSDEERIKEAKDKQELLIKVPSLSFQRELAKDIAQTLIGHKVSQSKLQEIFGEIEKATVMDITPETLASDLNAGILDNEGAASFRGYPEGTVAKAKIDHADRLARIMQAQSKKQGEGDTQLDPNADKNSKTASQTSETNPDGGKKVRGKE